MTTTAAAARRLADVRRHQRDPHPDPVQCRIDRDWLVGEVERLEGDILALRSALLELSQLARDANATLSAVKVVAGRVANDRSLNGKVPS